MSPFTTAEYLLGMASLDDDGIPYERPEAMLRSDDTSSEEDMPSSRRGGARLDANGASKAGAKTTAQRVNSGKYVVPGQTTLGFGREQKSFLKPAAAKQNVAKTVATSSGSGAVAKASAAKTLPETGQGNGAAARASSANTMASTNEGSRGTSSSSSSKGYLDLDALLDGLGESSKCYLRPNGRGEDAHDEKLLKGRG